MTTSTDRTRGSDGPEKSAAMNVLVMILTAVIVFSSFRLYVYGYRLTADDAEFFMHYLQGRESVEAHTWFLATNQGRIGQLLMAPLNTLGAYVAGGVRGMALVMALYAAQLFLFSCYVSLLVRARVALFVFLMLVVLHPLAYEHMPPNSYPLQNTVPFILIVLLRIAGLRGGAVANPLLRRGLAAAAWLLFVACMVVGEFSFIFGTALLLAEYTAALLRSCRAGRGPVGAVCDLLADGRFWADAAAVAVVLAAYLVFRSFHPTYYGGHEIADAGNVSRLLETLFRHILAGTVLPRLDVDWLELPRTVYLQATAVAVASGAGLYLVSGGLRGMRAPLIAGVLALVCAVYVTLPLALTTKQQVWCVDDDLCGYLDTRISYLGLVVALACGAAALLRAVPAPRVAAAVICVVLGGLAGVTYAHNWAVSRTMLQSHNAWKRASALACDPEALAADDAQLTAMIDPQGRLVLHPWLPPVAEMWRLFLRSKAEQRGCAAPQAGR